MNNISKFIGEDKNLLVKNSNKGGDKIIEQLKVFYIELNKVFDGRTFSPLTFNASDHKSIGYYKIGLGKLDEARYHFYKATFYGLLINELKHKNIFPKIKENINEPLARMANANTFITGLICGNENMLLKFAENLQKSEMDAENDFPVISALLKKQFILKESNEIEILKKRLYSKKFNELKGWLKGDMLCMKGILENNVEMFNDGVEIIIKAFKREASSWVYNGVSLQATALVKLGQRMGLKPDISNELISKELLNAENKTFEEDDELKSVLQQLEEMNNGKKEEEKKKDGGFFGKLFGG